MGGFLLAVVVGPTPGHYMPGLTRAILRASTGPQAHYGH